MAVTPATTEPVTPMPRGGERFGAWFDAFAADAACGFFPKYLRHTEGEWAGRPFQLAPWQADRIIRPIFGWKRADGSRLIRQAYIEVPRKNGKTELAAGVSLLALVGDAEIGGQAYSMAVDKEQAKLVFHKAGVMVGFSRELAELLEVFKTSIFCPQLMASFKPLSSGPANKHGFSPSFAIGDEVHEWPNGDLHDVVHKGTGARRQPLEILITTAGVRGRGYGWELHEYARQVDEGLIEDPAFLPVVFAAGQDDDWTDPAVWAKANPNLDVSIKRDYLEAECRKAQASPRLENDFRRFHLNQWTEQVTRWLPLDRWDACTSQPANAVRWRELEAELAGRKCWGGVDLSSTSDLISLTWAFPPRSPLERLILIWRIWVPADSLRRRVEQDRVPYDVWHAAGSIAKTDGNVADYRVIREQIFADAERFQVQKLAIDRWNATQFAVELQEEGLPVEFFGQGFASMAAPTKEMERLVLAGALDHGGHPVARWAAGNVAVEQDAAGNIKPAKNKSTEKIDPMVSAIMAIGVIAKGGEEVVDLSSFLANPVMAF